MIEKLSLPNPSLQKNTYQIVVRADDFHQLVGKRFVGFDVGRPQARVKAAGGRRRERQQIVQHRPQLLLAEAAVVAFAQVGPQEHGAAAVGGGEFQGDGVLFVGRDFGGQRADVEDVGAVDALL